MNIDVKGHDSKIAGRDFEENTIHIEQYEDSKIVNILPNVEQKDVRLLVSAQRKKLNELVKEVAENCGEEKFIIWQKVHAESGVNNINEITINQYHPIIDYLEGLLDDFKEERDKKALIHFLLKNTDDNKELRDDLMVYCQFKFAMKSLFSELNCSQLRQALGWLYEKIHEEKNPSYIKNLFDLLGNYLKEFTVVFLVGFFIGMIIYSLFDN
ncbi:MAG TPA: hypothetical protein ACHBZ9_08470 [Arsenophonus nasoniae]|uniref:hypothetical protein n=1 Tax=Arsenophonus nasoniae TaxID=638 RepID=UPI003879126F